MSEPAGLSNLSKMIEKGVDGQYHLIGSKCLACGKISFMEREVCPACASFDGHEKVLIGKRGKIRHLTVAHVAPSGYQAPYIVGFIDLAEGPQIFSPIEGDLTTASRIRVGDEVRLSVATEKDTILGWRYILSGGECNA